MCFTLPANDLVNTEFSACDQPYQMHVIVGATMYCMGASDGAYRIELALVYTSRTAGASVPPSFLHGRYHVERSCTDPRRPIIS